ncbi:nucleotide sugar dehydrogenase [Paenibacillus dendritiformis]|uniref:Nucleotide sugar dehydrogenase n=1 Tax=Paenibacillus dendritiformis C454 TaxID=1131935 RepID=H3S9M7_9BACL|nr:nucleotide sugar dehydrogenase [Paenibacillus dendritiformis]EHQ64145.1 nucleotide sugar dehydrogenase [Paenibacillus dendritiformis C454]CAH8767334.1 nucleotide sugar dehydrogenase [Paenibacillus dendritiformis]
MKVCVIGLGYIGLPTAATLTNCGFNVVGVDINSNVVEMLNMGKIHIEEPGLGQIIKTAVEKKLFSASNIPEEADVYIIAVPTPNKHDSYMSCDLTYVLDACRSIFPYIKNGSTIIIESTIAPRSMDDIIKPLFEKNGFSIGKDIYLAHCPERVLPGRILTELINNNRIVGGITKECSVAAAKIYKSFVKGEIIETEAKIAEMSKCMENTFRDVNIALSNELVKVCNDLNINALEVIRLANKHPRVNIHSPGPGVGGHCLAVDPYFIYAKSPEYAKMIKLSRDINNSMPQFVVEISKTILSDIQNPQIAIFGVTYKGNVDDLRESPAIKVINLLKNEGFQLAIHDPHVNRPDFVTCFEAAAGSDLILILSDHDEFKDLNHREIAKIMRTPRLLDTKNIITPQLDSNLEIINFGSAFEYKNKSMVNEKTPFFMK